MDKKILKQLKSEYEELEISPSVDFWSKIEGGIDSQSDNYQSDNSSKKYWLASACIILLISIGIFTYQNNDIQKKTTKNITLTASVIEQERGSVTNLEYNKKNSVLEIVVRPKKITSLKNDNRLASKPIPTSLNEIQNIPEIPAQVDLESQETAKILQNPNNPEQLAVSEPKVIEKKVKYVTANDLIFQNKYNIDSKEKIQDNNRRFGIFKVNMTNISPEVITIFNSSTSE